MNKSELLAFMHAAGFDWICDVAYQPPFELIATKKNGSEDLWWRTVETEGSGFERMFKGAIRGMNDEKSH